MHVVAFSEINSLCDNSDCFLSMDIYILDDIQSSTITIICKQFTD